MEPLSFFLFLIFYTGSSFMECPFFFFFPCITFPLFSFLPSASPTLLTKQWFSPPFQFKASPFCPPSPPTSWLLPPPPFFLSYFAVFLNTQCGPPLLRPAPSPFPPPMGFLPTSHTDRPKHLSPPSFLSLTP